MKIKEIIKRSFRYILKGIPIYKIYPNIVTIGENKLLENRIALITGGTSGIGFEIAKSFIQAGATVIITGRNVEKLTKAINELSLIVKDKCYGIAWDIRDINSYESKFQDVLKLCGNNIDILVNNAGIIGGHINNVTESEYDNVLDSNLKSVFFLSRLVARHMISNNIKGNILNIASSSSLRPADSAYNISKWGIRGFTEGLSRLLAPKGIVVNGIAPGPTATPVFNKNKVNDDISLEKSIIGRYIMPCEIANMAVILTSDLGKSIIGDIVYMTGGAGNVSNEDVSYNFK